MNEGRISALCKKSCPTFINETIEHAQCCLNLVQQEGASDDLKTNQKVLCNLYRRFAKDILILSKLMYLKNNNVITPETKLVCDMPVSVSVQEKLIRNFKCITFLQHSKKNQKRLSSINLKFRMFTKIIVNKFYRVFGALLAPFTSKNKVKDTIVRTWVDVSFELFPLEMRESEILVYPFGINISRQWKYIKRLSNENYSFKLTGYNYSIMKFFRWLVSGDDSDLAALEMNAAINHSSELLSHNIIKHVCTTDEFEPASFVLNKQLIRSGLTVLNKAHGVGKYSPFVECSRFIVLNKAQEDYYQQFSPNVNFVAEAIMQESESKFEKIKTVVFIDQLVTPDETALCLSQKKIISELEKLCYEYNLKFVVKIHPNSKKIDSLYSHLQYRGDVKNLSNPLFFTIFSTAYISFQKYGKTFLLKDEVFDPSIIFGAEARVVDVNSLRGFFCGYI